MKEYLKAQSKTTDAVISDTFSTDELERFSKSDYRWADNRTKQYRHAPGDMLPPLKSYDFEVGASCSIAF